jgi:hypothetical protein
VNLIDFNSIQDMFSPDFFENRFDSLINASPSVNKSTLPRYYFILRKFWHLNYENVEIYKREVYFVEKVTERVIIHTSYVKELTTLENHKVTGGIPSMKNDDTRIVVVSLKPTDDDESGQNGVTNIGREFWNILKRLVIKPITTN